MLTPTRILMIAGLMLAVTAPASASQIRASHAAGFICGAGPGATNDRFVNGDYRAAFNVLNGARYSQRVAFRLSLTFPAVSEDGPGATFTPGRVIELESVHLKPGEAVMIDCRELADAAGLSVGEGRPPYFSGVLDITSVKRLDITLLQSAGPRDGDVSSYSVTPVKGRYVRR